MTLVFRNRLDPDNGRQIFPPVPPVTTINTVAAIKAALLVPGSYTVAAGTYAASFDATVAGVSINCQSGVVFNSPDGFAAPWAVDADNFRLTGDWLIHASGNIGIRIGNSTNTLQSQQPDNVLIDGGTILAPTSGQMPLRAIEQQGSNVTLSNLRIEGFFRAGLEVQALCTWNTNGPMTVTDCFLEGAGENFLSGGADIAIPDAVPSDLTFLRNTFYKRPSWQTQSPTPTVKNIFELKNAQRVLAQDNVFDGCWAQAQAGIPIVFTVRNSAQANHPTTPSLWNSWVVVDHITFQHNIFRNVTDGVHVFNILGHDDGGRESLQTTNITIQNNLSEDNPGFVQLNSGVTELLLIDHNTSAADIAAEFLIFVNTTTKSVITITNNVINQGVYGIKASGQGIPALVEGCGTNYTVTGNVFGKNKTQSVTWPPGNSVVAGGVPLTPAPDCQLTGSHAGDDAGWSGPAGVGLNGDGTSP